MGKCRTQARVAGIAVTAALTLSVAPHQAYANGRMPGANDVVFNALEPAHFLTRATYGIMQTFDAGATFSWTCEQVIDVSGVVADPPVAVMTNGTLVLLPPTGSALISRDKGCSFTRAEGAPAGQRGVDLTGDPSDPQRLLLLMSTLDDFDAEGYGIFRNELIDSRDDAKTFQKLATLPTDFEAETVEVAKSDPQRIYVSGTHSKDARLGIIERSEDGGQTWTRTTLALPAGSGSLFISGIAPDDADKLWVRVPARGDTLGILPARLMWSEDKGESFTLLAATQRAMFGFALSPDGKQLAYGGPTDGLFVGPSDGSGSFEKKSDLGIRCLRWNAAGLFACASEPRDPFSLGVSDDEGGTFKPLYRMLETCPLACDDSTSFNRDCQAEWQLTRPFIQAMPQMCAVPWSVPDEPAGTEDAGTKPSPDAGSEMPGDSDHHDAGSDLSPKPRPASKGGGCEISSAHAPSTPNAGYLLLLASGMYALRRRHSKLKP